MPFLFTKKRHNSEKTLNLSNLFSGMHPQSHDNNYNKKDYDQFPFYFRFIDIHKILFFLTEQKRKRIGSKRGTFTWLPLKRVQKKVANRKTYNLLAEREGFEPPVPRSTTVFKTAAIDHSAISPETLSRSVPFQKRCKGTTYF